ncbi:MAG: chemotaxis protein CheC [Bacillota bacterium]|nr:chemotaxis protein CheC [Bacillota bacterium]
MVNDFCSLSPLQVDALKEIGNIGAGNAATALSKLINDRVQMSVPRVRILPFAKVAEIVGGAETLVAGIYLKISGSAPGGILFLLPFSDAKQLVNILLQSQAGESVQPLSELERSALMEVGNILTGSFLNALAMFTSLSYFPSVPALSADMAGALLGTVFYDLGKTGDYALFIETEFRYQTNHVVGYLFFLPEADSLDRILSTLGVST